jgi:hypothetical protein
MNNLYRQNNKHQTGGENKGNYKKKSESSMVKKIEGGI